MIFANPMQYGQGGIGYVTQPMTRQVAATRQAAPVRLPMPTRDNGSAPPMQAQPGPRATLSSVQGPIGGNLSLAGSMLGLATGSPMLGLLGGAVQAGREAQAYGDLYQGYMGGPGFQPNYLSGLLSNVTGGLFGTRIPQQANNFVRDSTGLSQAQYDAARATAARDIAARADIFGGGSEGNERGNGTGGPGREGAQGARGL